MAIASAPRAFSRRAAARKSDRDALRALMVGSTPFPEGLAVRERELPGATLEYLRIGRVFRSEGLAAALRVLPPRRAHAARGGVDAGTAFHARDAAWRVMGLARTFGGRHLCLHESLGACAALRRLGFAAQVVIGYPVIELADGGDELHAWPALGSMPLVGRPGGQPLGYVEVERFPER